MKIVHFIKEHIYETAAAGTGFLSTLVVDWHHIAERAVETFILATVNGASAAAAGFIVVYVLKKFIKK